MPPGEKSPLETPEIKLSPERQARIVEILAKKFPLNNEGTIAIVGPFHAVGFCSGLGLEKIVEALRETGVNYATVVANENEILSAFSKKIGYPPKPKE